MPNHPQNCAASSATPLSARRAAIAARIPYRQALKLLRIDALPAYRLNGWRWRVPEHFMPEWRAVAHSWRAKRGGEVPPLHPIGGGKDWPCP